MTCINCNNEHAEKFCPNCGENANVKKITFNSIFEEAFSTITNMDKGFLYNLKSLTINPHGTITQYINGKRKGIYNPFSFLLISITVYLIIDSFVEVPSQKIEGHSKFHSIGYEAGYFIANYFKYFWAVAILWLTFSIKVVFRTYNYAEYLAICSFILGYATLAGIAGLLFKWKLLIYNPLIYIVILFMIYHLFRNEKDKFESLLQSLLCVILFFFQLFSFIIIIGIIMYSAKS